MKGISKLLSLLMVVGLLVGIQACVDEPEEVTSINLLSNFVDGGDGVYTLDINSTNALSLSFDKKTFEYGNVRKDLSDVAADFTNMKSLNVTLQGSGVAVLLKLESKDGSIGREVQVNADTIQQSFSWDLEDESDFLAVLGKVLVFAAPGQVNVTGSVLISKLTLSVEPASTEQGTIIEAGFRDFVKPDANVFNGTDNEFLVGNFYDGGDKVYTISETNKVTQVDYDKTATQNTFAFMVADIQGELSQFARLVFEVTGTLNYDILLKLEGTQGFKEVRLSPTGNKQEVVIDLLAFLPAQLDAMNKIVIFGSPGVVGEAADFTLHAVRFEKALANVNTGWVGLDAGVYTPTQNTDGSVDIAYNKVDGQQYSVLLLDIPTKYQMLNVLTMVFQGSAGQTILVKPNDLGALEQSVTLTNSQPVTITIKNDGFTKIILFAMPNVAPASGTFKIVSTTLDFEAKEFDPTLIVDVNKGWAENDANTYSISYTDGVARVAYVNSAWQFMRVNFDINEVAGLNTLTLTVSGSVGKNILVKPNDSGALERRIEFTTTNPITVTFTAESFANILIFAEGGTEGASGIFFIHSAVLSYTYHVETITSNEHYVVTDGDNGFNVAYNKAGDGYRFLNVVFPATDVSGLNTLTVTLSGTVGESVLLKPNDNGSLERAIAFTTTDPVSETFTFAQFNNLIMFAQPGNATATGTFTIVSITLSYTAEIPAPEWKGFGLTVVQTETNVSITYANTPGEWWNNNAQLAIPNFDGTKKAIELTYTGVAGQEYVFKIEGGGQAREVTVSADGTLQSYILDLSTFTEAQRDGFTLLVVFAKTAGGSGTLVLNNWTYYLAPEWKGFGLTVVQTETNVSITYANTPGEWWNNNAQLAISNFDGAKTAIVLTYTGVAGQEYVFKIEGGGQAREVTVSADGTLQTYVLDLSTFTEAQRDGFTLLVVFAKTAGGSGTLVLNNWTYQN
jgi:hypothetical protein